jgi:pilus assembly protein CpaC
MKPVWRLPVSLSPVVPWIVLSMVVAVDAPVQAKPFMLQAVAVSPSQQPSGDAVHGQPITLEAGTGVLVPLPKPATTILSAEPSIARVQPASPTSLFLMGVAPGHTTIIATSENGAAIVQYDVTVTGAGGRAGPIFAPDAAPGAAMPQVANIGPGTMLSIQRSTRWFPGDLRSSPS